MNTATTIGRTPWPDTLELTLDGIAQGGEGVGRYEGRVVFAGGGLPGETVRVRLDELRESYARGQVVTVLAPAPDRVEPRLPGADHMPWQHIAYPAQLRFKRQILADQLAKIGGIEQVAIAETLPSARIWNYRNSARMHVADGQIGYFAADTRTLQPIDDDPLLLPVLNHALAVLRAVLEPGDALDEVTLRASETHGYVVAALWGAGDLRGLARRWRAACPALAGVVPLGQPSIGAEDLIEEFAGLAFQLRPTTFLQVNIASAATLLDLVRAGLQVAAAPPARLLDLYCGAGAFTLPLAQQCGEVIGVEEFAAAVADAGASAEINGVANALFRVGKAEWALERIAGPFDGVVLDPPRRGCHPQALDALVQLASPRLVYVSCHPATLARDLKILVAGGYRLISVQPVDLFPQTAHIESVCVLERAAE